MKTPQEWMTNLSIHDTPNCDTWSRDIGNIQNDARADLLDRIKVLEGERDSIMERFRELSKTNENHYANSCKLTSILRRIPLDLLRVEEHRQLYLDMCAALNIEPWVEK